jgi:PilZ domain
LSSIPGFWRNWDRRRSSRASLPIHALIAGEKVPVTDISLNYARIVWGGRVPRIGTPVPLTLQFGHPRGERSLSLWGRVARTDPERREFVVRFGELDRRLMRELVDLLDSLSAIWRAGRI